MPESTLTNEELLQSFQAQFKSQAELNIYLELMRSFLGIKIAEANQRIANAQATQAQEQANTVIQAAAQQMSIAQSQFDALASQIAEAT